MASATALLWGRLAPGTDAMAAAGALLGWPPDRVSALATVAVAASDEAGRVLAQLPTLARSARAR